MKYEVQIRMNNVGPTKYLMATEKAEDLNSAFAKANKLLQENEDCFAEIREEGSNEVVTSIAH